jgi:hypothetical protein
MSYAFPNIERVESGPIFLDRAEVRPVTATHRKLAEERYTKDVELIADWLNTASDEREQSDFWGPISTTELAQLLFSGALNQEQCKAASDELRKRYLDDNEARIAHDAARMA